MCSARIFGLLIVFIFFFCRDTHGDSYIFPHITSTPFTWRIGGDKPPKSKTDRKEWQFTSDFRDLHERYPELVGEDGNGGYARHIHNAAEFIENNTDIVGKDTLKLADKIDGFDLAWRKKVIQYQVPLFSKNTHGEFILRFDDAIANALELGPLRTDKYRLTNEQKQWVDDTIGSVVPKNVTYTLLKYYFANKTEDSDWVILPCCHRNFLNAVPATAA